LIRAVLDPGVLIAGAISPKGTPASLLRAWQQGVFELILSRALVDELQRALNYPKILQHVSRDEATTLIRALEAGALVVPDPTDVPAVCRDPADDYLFALALSAGAALVSGDAGVLAVTDAGVRVVRPAAFAQLLEGPGSAT